MCDSKRVNKANKRKAKNAISIKYTSKFEFYRAVRSSA